MFCPDDGKSTFYSGLGIGADLKEEVPFLIRRRTTQSALFLTVYDLSGKPESALIATAKLVPPNGRNDVCGVRIALRDGHELRAWLDLRDPAEPVRLEDGQTFTRFRLDQSAP